MELFELPPEPTNPQHLEFQLTPFITKQVTTVITKAQLFITEIVLFSHAIIVVYLFNEIDCVVDTRQFRIEGNEYTAWASNDAYIVELIKKKLMS